MTGARTPEQVLNPAADVAERPPVLRLSDIRKTFGGARALDGVSLDILPGEVHGLLGKNGSGKSTLVKILAGFHAPDEGGRLEFNGRLVALPLRPGDFRRLGMSFVHQSLGLAPSLTVLENMRVAHLTTAKTAFIDWRAERAEAEAAFARFGLAVDPRERVDRLSPVDRALVAIVRAFEEIREECAASGKPGLVLLDEPTPFLPREGVERLFEMIRAIARTGSSVIFVSHNIEEVMTITDRITVLRDGRVGGRLDTREATHEDVVEAIIGRRLGRLGSVARDAAAAREPQLVATDVSGGALQNCSLAIGKGEIVGVTGLIGSGYAELPYLIFGAKRCRSGEMRLAGAEPAPLAAIDPKRAIGLGLAFLPGDRQAAGGVDSLPVVDNLFLPDVDRFFRRGRLDRRRMLREAFQLGARFEVRPNDPGMKLSSLSGGNAQKVLIARWMNRNPRLLLLDEPTQGVDVGTRVHIFAALRAAAAEGMSVLCASSDAEQLAEICDRVLVFARGQVCAELSGGPLTKDQIAEACYASNERGATRPQRA